MGGNRFKHHESVRLNAPDAMVLETEVVRRLKAIGIDAFPTMTFPGKANYGDLDIIIAEEELLVHAGLPSEEKSPAHQAREAMIPVLGAVAMARSGPTDHATSYLLPTEHGPFQIDLITHPQALVPYAIRFYAWGDLGALVSMTARRLGLSNKAIGLHVVVGDINDRLHIPVAADYNEALELIGFDAAVHEAGFATYEDAFRWIATSHHFDPETYQLENLTAASRVRAIKRPMQMAFRQWIEDTQPPAKDQIVIEQDDDGGWKGRERNDEKWREKWRQTFTNVSFTEQAHLSRVQVQRAANQARRNLMSGPAVAAKTGLEGKELTLLMRQITKHPRYAEMMKATSDNLLDLIIADTRQQTGINGL